MKKKKRRNNTRHSVANPLKFIELLWVSTNPLFFVLFEA